MAPVKPHTDLLKRAGYRSFLQLNEPSDWVLLIPFPEARAVIARLAHLRRTLQPKLDKWAIEILHELIERDKITEVAVIGQANVTRRTKEAAGVAGAILRRCKPGDENKERLTASLAAWFSDRSSDDGATDPQRRT